MKRLLLVSMLLVMSIIFVSCTGTVATPTAAWAGIEVLEYAVEDANGQVIGIMTTTMRRKATEGFSNTIDDKEYNTADCRMEMAMDTELYKIDTVILAKGINTLAISKVFVDKQDQSNSYTLKGHQDGKRFVYSINDGQQVRLNVGSSGYTLNEYLYMYLRCYDIGSVPAQIKIPDVENNAVVSIGATAKTQALSHTVAYPDSTKSVLCNKVEINLNESPVGKGITVYYTPDEAPFNVDSFGASSATSKKIPVLIVENDISYRLVSMYIP